MKKRIQITAAVFFILISVCVAAFCVNRFYILPKTTEAQTTTQAAPQTTAAETTRETETTKKQQTAPMEQPAAKQ
ncbi:MAG: hypothetical protein ACI4XE_09110, partial [Acutalibacteraceae bacterium]